MYNRCLLVSMLVLLVVLEAMSTELTGNELKKKHKKRILSHLPQNLSLGKRDLCESTEYKCAAGGCISADEVCDTHRNCFGGDDEKNCPTDCTGAHQFKCENSQKCIGIVDKCDGYPDCTDYSDETFCDNFECLAGGFKCVSSNECVQPDYLCDGEADCQDGSDEKNCVSGSCSSWQFRCADGDRCVAKVSLCDGHIDCLDHSDESGCSCKTGQFKCNTGVCISTNFVCDGHSDCVDASDELNCPSLPSTLCLDIMTYEDCFRMNETTHPICLIYDDGNKFCRKFCGFCK